MVNQANNQAKNANLTEIMKKVVYAPDNFLLRALEEQAIAEKIHQILF